MFKSANMCGLVRNINQDELSQTFLRDDLSVHGSVKRVDHAVLFGGRPAKLSRHQSDNFVDHAHPTLAIQQGNCGAARQHIAGSHRHLMTTGA